MLNWTGTPPLTEPNQQTKRFKVLHFLCRHYANQSYYQKEYIQLLGILWYMFTSEGIKQNANFSIQQEMKAWFSDHAGCSWWHGIRYMITAYNYWFLLVGAPPTLSISNILNLFPMSCALSGYQWDCFGGCKIIKQNVPGGCLFF